MTRASLTALVGLSILVAVPFAPTESTLGDGIRAVYVHVSWTWAGLALAAVFAFGSVAAAIVGQRRFERPLHRAYGFAFVYLALGMLSSFVAAHQNWGAIAWTEPRTQALIRVLLVLAFAWPVAWLLRAHPRIRLASLATVVVVSVGWLYVVPRVLHPEAPVGTSDSVTMKAVFYGLTVAWLAIAALWITPRRVADSLPDASPANA